MLGDLALLSGRTLPTFGIGFLGNRSGNSTGNFRTEPDVDGGKTRCSGCGLGTVVRPTPCPSSTSNLGALVRPSPRLGNRSLNLCLHDCCLALDAGLQIYLAQHDCCRNWKFQVSKYPSDCCLTICVTGLFELSLIYQSSLNDLPVTQRRSASWKPNYVGRCLVSQYCDVMWNLTVRLPLSTRVSIS